MSDETTETTTALTAAECNEGISVAADRMLAAAAEGDRATVDLIHDGAQVFANVRDRVRALARAYAKAQQALDEAEVDEVGKVMDLAPYDVSECRISTTILTVQLMLSRLFEQAAMDLAPAYQRASNLWSRVKCSQLIESMLMRLPIPDLYVHESGANGEWSVVDGLQRISAISSFVVGDMKLGGMEYLTTLNGQRFKDLPGRMQRQIMETNLAFHIVEASTPMGVVFNLFKRLNTGGLRLTAQEIRNALNQGPAVDCLADMADDEAFSACTSNGVSGKRAADVEAALRWLSFAMHGLDAPSVYQVSDMDGWLCAAMQRLNKLNPIEQDKWRQRWGVICQGAFNIWGGEAFRKPVGTKRSGVSKALLDSFGWALNSVRDGYDSDHEFLAACEEAAAVVTNAHAAAIQLDAEYLASISYSTRDVAAVRKRLAVAAKCCEALNGITL